MYEKSFLGDDEVLIIYLLINFLLSTLNTSTYTRGDYNFCLRYIKKFYKRVYSNFFFVVAHTHTALMHTV